MADDIQGNDQLDGDFFGGGAAPTPATAAPATAQAPEPAFTPPHQAQPQNQVPRSTAAVSEPLATPVAEPAPMPPHLLAMAEEMGVLEDAKKFTDPAALTQSLRWYYREQQKALRQPPPAQAQPEQRAQPSQQPAQGGQQQPPVQADDVFVLPPDNEEFQQFHPLIKSMARTIDRLQQEAKAARPADDLQQFRNNLPQLVSQAVAEHQQAQQNRAIIVQAAKDLGHGEAVVTDPAFQEVFTQIANAHVSTLRSMGRALPDLAVLAKTVIPSIIASPAAPGLTQPPAQRQQQPAAAAPVARDDRGKFVSRPPIGAPTHRSNGEGAGEGNALRNLYIDAGQDPGPPAEQVNLRGEFFGGK